MKLAPAPGADPYYFDEFGPLRSRWDPFAGAYDAERDLVLTPAGAPYTAVVATEEYHSWPTHEHQWHELIWPIQGTLQVTCAGRVIPVPRGLGLCVRSRQPHSATASAGAILGFRWLASVPTRFSGATLLSMSAALRETIWHINSTVLEPEPRARAIAFADDLLAAAALTPRAIPFTVTMANTEPLASLCTSLADHPDDPRTLEEWAHCLHVSSRTLARQFATELGTTFTRWRTDLRLSLALPLLASGLSVTETSHRLGYSTVSAFTAVFGQRLGVTPGRYTDLLIAS